MPFSRGRSDAGDRALNFDAFYAEVISPAVSRAGLMPHRADEETLGGIFHERMFERLVVCEYAVADLSMANPNVFYELGVRHATRPWSTVVIFGEDTTLPLDVAEVHALRYGRDLMSDTAAVAAFQDQLTERLRAAQRREVDSPVHRLVTGLPVMDVDHRRVDLMLEQVDREADLNRRIARASREGLSALERLRDELPPLHGVESESVVALMLAFRAVEGWTQMLQVVEAMAPELRDVWLVVEQHGLALARVGRFLEAEELLKALLERRPNSETYALLGGVYKRQWAQIRTAESETLHSRRLLRRAANMYKAGFDVDLRDPYPGVNAVSLLALLGDRRAVELLAPVVRYSIEHRLRAGVAEYWDYGCSLSLAVVTRDFVAAETALNEMEDLAQDPFETGSTLEGLELMRELFADDASSADRLEGLIRRAREIGASL